MGSGCSTPKLTKARYSTAVRALVLQSIDQLSIYPSSTPVCSCSGSQGTAGAFPSSSKPPKKSKPSLSLCNFQFLHHHDILTGQNTSSNSKFLFCIFYSKTPEHVLVTPQKVKHSSSPQREWCRADEEARIKFKGRVYYHLTGENKQNTSSKLWKIKTNLKPSWETIYNIAWKTTWIMTLAGLTDVSFFLLHF